MHIVESHLPTLFYDHECVVLPGLGGFILRSRSARVHPTSFIMHPPGSVMGFNERLKDNDGLLMHHLSALRGLPYSEAELLVTDYVKQIKSHLMQGEGVLINKVGRLHYDIEGKLQFSPDLGVHYDVGCYGLPEITAKPIQRAAKVLPIETKSFKPVMVKKRSNISARNLIISAAAILLIAILVLPIRNNSSMARHQWAHLFDTADFQLHAPELSAQAYQPQVFLPTDIAGSRSTDSLPALSDATSNLDEQITHLLVSGAFKPKVLIRVLSYKVICIWSSFLFLLEPTGMHSEKILWHKQLYETPG
jgi:hypothetical protein